MPREIDIFSSLEEKPGAIAACNSAMTAAAGNRHDLLVVNGAFLPGDEALGMLAEALHSDPFFGFAMPRGCDPDTGALYKIVPELGDPQVQSVPRRVIGEIPETYILPETLASCLLIRWELLVNLLPLDAGFETLAGALLHFLMRARRLGFRCVAVNRAIVAARELAVPPRLSEADEWKLRLIYPDMKRSREEMRRIPVHVHESLLARAAADAAGGRRTLLIDGKGMSAFHNGTSQCVLSLADGIAALHPDWEIGFMAWPDAIAFHDLAKRYPGWDLVQADCGRYFTAILRPSQPFHIITLRELHNLGLFNIYAVLDTIAWDALYPAPPGLDATYQFLATHSDGLMYNSEFTRQRFTARFPLAPGTPELTFYHSFHPRDYVNPAALEGQPDEPYLLAIGNQYDHKNLEPTVALLSDAFPLHRIKALGCAGAAAHGVERIPAGYLAELDMERLYAHAGLIVFPSFYEGFGLPIIQGLSYGRTVIARHSELLDELAAHYRGPGRLVGYHDAAGLVEMVGRCLHGLPTPDLPLGAALAPGEEPLDWRAIARRVIAFVEESTGNISTARWLERERVIQQIVAYGT